jgi:anti-anti-sigma regulatory factor
MDELEPARAASIRVRDGLGESQRPITLIHVYGEHDFGSRAILASALAPLEGHVVIDLTPCTYLDSAVIGAILGKALALGKAGYRLELVVPDSGSVSHIVKRLGIHALIPLLDEPPTIHPSPYANG